MKKNIISFLIILLVFILLFSGCSTGPIIGSDSMVTKKLNPTPENFTGVDIGSAFEVEIIQSDIYRVTITTNENLFKYLDISNKDNILKIGLKPKPYFQNTKLKAKILMPELLYVNLHGSTNAHITGFENAESFEAQLSGSSILNGDISVSGNASFDLSGSSILNGDISVSGNVDFDLSGSSDIELKGSANDVNMEVSGASTVFLKEFPINNLEFDISGASTVTINAVGELNGQLSGASTLYYYGDPTLGDIDISGAAKLSKID